MNTKFKILGVLLLFFYSCQNNKKTEVVDTDSYFVARNDSMFIADLDTAKCEKNIYLSSYFSKAHYIPLETNTNSLLGRINEMQIKGDTIFILDLAISRTLQMFDKSGKHLGIVGGRGKGPGEYSRPTDFGIDGNRLYLFDSTSQKILFYQLPDMSYSHSISIEAPDGLARSRYIAMEDGHLYADIYLPKEQGPYLVREIDKNNNVIHRWLSVNLHNRGYLRNDYFTGKSCFRKIGSGIKYYHFLTDTIMQISQGEMFPYLAIQYKKRSTDEAVNKYCLENDKDALEAMIRLGGVNEISEYVEWNDYIMFTFKLGIYFQTAIVNKKTREFRWTDHLKCDLTFSPEKEINIHPIPVMGDDKGLYFYIHSMEMEKFLEMVQNGETLISGDDLEKLKSLPIDSNPVLIYYEISSNERDLSLPKY